MAQVRKDLPGGLLVDGVFYGAGEELPTSYAGGRWVLKKPSTKTRRDKLVDYLAAAHRVSRSHYHDLTIKELRQAVREI